MIKLFEEICDSFTDKEYNFSVKKEDANEVLEMLQKSTLHCKMFDSKKVITNTMTLNTTVDNNEVIFNINISLKKSEWTKLLTLCANHGYQLVVKEDKDIMCFIKKETK